MVSAELASVGGWEIIDQYTMGSDCVPIISKFPKCFIEEPANRTGFPMRTLLKNEEILNEGRLVESEGRGMEQLIS